MPLWRQLRAVSVSSYAPQSTLHVFGAQSAAQALTHCGTDGSPLHRSHPITRARLFVREGSASADTVSDIFREQGGTKQQITTVPSDSDDWRRAEHQIASVISRSEGEEGAGRSLLALKPPLDPFHDGVFCEFLPSEAEDTMQGFLQHVIPTDALPSGKPRIYLCIETTGLTARDIGEMIATSASLRADGVILIGENVATKYRLSDLSYASQGRIHGLPVFNGGASLLRFAERHAIGCMGDEGEGEREGEEEEEEDADGLKLIGIYHSSTRRERMLSVAGAEARGVVRPNGQRDRGTQPWVLLAGRRSGTANPTAVGTDPAVYEKCALGVNLLPRNDASYGVPAAAAVVLNALVRARLRSGWKGQKA